MKKLMRQLCSILPFVCILVTQSCPTLCDSMDCSPPGKDTRVGMPFPSPEDLPNPGIKPGSPALQADSLPSELWGSPLPFGQSQKRKRKKNMEQPGDLCNTVPILLGWFSYSFCRYLLWASIKKSFKWTIGALVMSVSMSTCMFFFLIYVTILLSPALNFISHKLIVFISNSSLHNKFRSQVYCFLDMWHWQII